MVFKKKLEKEFSRKIWRKKVTKNFFKEKKNFRKIWYFEHLSVWDQMMKN